MQGYAFSDNFGYSLEELKECIVDYDPDIIEIQETHLRPADRVSISNYTCHRSDRTTHRGEGTALFVKNSIRHHAILNISNTFENSSVIIQIGNNSKITVACIYRPPHGSINTTELDAILNHSNKAFLFGDFNSKHPSWNPGRIDDLDLAVQNFTSNVSNAVSASTSTRLINTPYLRFPENIRELIRAKNRFRKLWNNIRYPPYKREVNALIRQIRSEIQDHKNRTCKNFLLTLNPEDNSLYNLHRKFSKRHTTFPPLHGPGGMAYSDFEKAEAFKDTLEVTFQENEEPYCDDKIEEVENLVDDYFDNFATCTPPLTSPSEILEDSCDGPRNFEQCETFLRSRVNEKIAQFCVTVKKRTEVVFPIPRIVAMVKREPRRKRWERGHRVTCVVSVKKLDNCPPSD
ncbi:uncharacterized protein TNCV_2445021 [Trichonephila clavipes]|nr:uncharacterized protein TNCV_2445021 [Trichonephila clavipes]